MEERNALFTICRKTLPSLKATAMKDFLDVLKFLDLYREANHNKTEMIYRLGTNEYEFISVDEPQKIRGRKRKYLWMNEANEFSHEDYRQLILRTTGQVFMDFNPSDEFHWIYEDVLTRPDCTFIQSTYKDNPFLEPEVIREIERLKDWRIYGLGERGISETTIYTHWKLSDGIENADELIYGLDFGFNNPTALVEIGIRDQDIYCQELLYESHLTNSQLIDKFNDLGISKKIKIYADAAEPQRIEEIRQAGYWIEPADKDVEKGIDTMKARKFYITKDSPNILKEVKSYRWKVKDEKIMDEPVKANDHTMDAIRYAVHTHLKQPFIGFA
jgi:phage terminase large subunit